MNLLDEAVTQFYEVRAEANTDKEVPLIALLYALRQIEAVLEDIKEAIERR
jgi:hypothetical protein